MRETLTRLWRERQTCESERFLWKKEAATLRGGGNSHVLIGNDAYYYVRPYVLQYRIQHDGSLRPLQPAAIRDGLGVLVTSMAVDGRDGLIYISSRDTLSAYKIGADGQLQFAPAVLSKENLPYPNDVDGGGLSRLQYDDAHHELLCGGSLGGAFESHLVILKLGQDGTLADRMDYHLSQGGRLTKQAIGDSCIPSALALDEKNSRLYAYVLADKDDGLQEDTMFFINIEKDSGFPPVVWCLPGTAAGDSPNESAEDDRRRFLIVTRRLSGIFRKTSVQPGARRQTKRKFRECFRGARKIRADAD